MPQRKEETEARERSSSLLWPRASDASSGLHERGVVTDGAGRVLRAEGGEPFELLADLGPSPYGRAHRARGAHGRPVAVHVLSLGPDPEGTFEKALPLAVATCAQLSHPNVVGIESHGHDPETGAPFLVGEPIEGRSLAAELAAAGRLSLARALGIALQIGRALRAAHKLRIVHGALSPACVRLLGGGSGERGPQRELVRVVGMGAALFGAPRDPALPELQGYLAPELRAGGVARPEADVYALGCLLYRMLTGTGFEPDAARAPGLPPAPGEPWPQEIEELLSVSLVADPSERLADVVIFMRQLRELARGISAEDPFVDLAVSGISSVPPAEPSEGAVTADVALRKTGAPWWIFAGLLVALWAVWLLWKASDYVRPELPRTREVPTQRGS